MLNIQLIMSKLAVRRPIFHSEADFQHAFALELANEEPTLDLRLEVPFAFEQRGATDLVARSGSFVSGIELKYLSRGLEHEEGGEIFRLKDQGATDLRRYDILRDIERLERFNREYGGPSYVIALTNDPAYWNPVRRAGTIDAAFRLCNGRNISGTCIWAAHAGAGTVKGRDRPITLEGAYCANWLPYSMLGTARGQFKYLLFSID